MADQKEKPISAEETAAVAERDKKVGEATSSDEIRDLVTQARDDRGRFVSTKTEPQTATTTTTELTTTTQEPIVYKDTFVIGGKEVEIIGADAADVLRQYKAAMIAYEIAKTPEPKKEELKPSATPEELAALGVRVSQGDLKALDEYLEKTGAIDRFLEKKGIKVEEVKQVLETQATASIKERWDVEVQAFLADSDWPGGTQNEYILKTKLAQLKDETGQPLAYNPSKENLQRAYEAMKSEGLVFKVEAPPKTETTQVATTTSATTQATTAQKKAATSSTLLGTSHESQVRKPAPAAGKLPEITPEMDGRQIMEAFKNYAIANNLNPDDVLRGTIKA